MRDSELSKYKDELLHIIKSVGAVKSDGSFTFVSGGDYPFKIELDDVLDCSDGCFYAGEIGRKIIRDIKKETGVKRYEIAGVATGGIAFAKAITDGDSVLDVDYKTGEIHGWDRKAPHIFFEDVSSTGMSIIKSRDLIETRGMEAKHVVILVVNFEEALDNLRSNGIEPFYIFTKEDLGVKFKKAST